MSTPLTEYGLPHDREGLVPYDAPAQGHVPTDPDTSDAPAGYEVIWDPRWAPKQRTTKSTPPPPAPPRRGRTKRA